MPCKRKPWFRPKKYLHITRRLDSAKDKRWVQQLVTNPKRVSQHAFFPLIHKRLTERRYKLFDYDENESQIRAHSYGGKRGRKVRPIHYATHIDSAIYAYYAKEKLQSAYEDLLEAQPELSHCITAYRQIPVEDDGQSCKSNIHFAKEVFDVIRLKGECCAMAFDIESFFTNLDHQILKRAWCKLLGTKSLPPDHYNIFKSITNYSYILLDDLRVKNGGFDEAQLARIRQEKGIHAFFASAASFREAIREGEVRVYKNQYHNQAGKNKRIRGIPQGLAISAMLANLYLLEFDTLVFNKVIQELGGLYRRYSDDIVIVCPLEKESEVQNFMKNSIQEFKLEISDSKTEVCLFEKSTKDASIRVSRKIFDSKNNRIIIKQGQPFRYLGFEFYGDKVLIKSRNLSKFYRRMKDAVHRKGRRIDKLIDESKPHDRILYRRKLYRTFSHLGVRSRKLPVHYPILRKKESTGEYRIVTPAGNRSYRGNYLSYVYRAAKIMEEPAIKRQVRKHWKILHRELSKLS